LLVDTSVKYGLGMSVEALDSGRGERTRAAILGASRQLFLERGYAGTPINAITEACGISRAGFYTYFKDKREVFSVLGETAYHDVMAALDAWANLARPIQVDAVTRCVADYFDYLDRHGAFVLSATLSAPDDEAFRNSRDRMVTRAAWKLGHALCGRGAHSPEVIGATVMGMLDRAWHSVQAQSVHVDRDEMIAVSAEIVVASAPSVFAAES
jgi:AcrR family transcriptional regulator